MAGAAAVILALVAGISDGDTMTVVSNNEQIKIRLAEIDAPEKRQAFGQRSKQSLSDLCYMVEAKISPLTKDRYGRTVAHIECNNTDASRHQISTGMAWAYRKYLKDKSLLDVEAEAKAARRGLWSDPDPIPPWEWRHRKQ